MDEKQKSKTEKEEKKKHKKHEADPFIWPFVGLALIKEQKPETKVVRQILLLAKAGIDFLLLRVGGGEAKPTEVKKIKIQ